MAHLVERAAHATDEAAQPVQRAELPVTEQRRRSRVFLLGGFAALLGYLVLLVAVRSNRSVRTDLHATIAFQRAEHPLVTRVMNAVSWFGFRPQSLLLPGTAVLGTWLLRFRVESLFLVTAWGASMMSFLTKLVIRRPRPNHPLIRVVEADILDSSFPSGHTLHYTAFWGFFTYLVFTKVRSRLIRGVTVGVVTPLIALVGASRVYLGHHWLTDVLASYLLGIAYLLGLVGLYQRVKRWTGS